MKPLSLLFLVVFSLACSSGSKAPQDQNNSSEKTTGSATERTFTIIVDAVTRTKTPGAHFNYKDVDLDKDLRTVVDLTPLTLKLIHEGYKKVTEDEKSEIQVEVLFKREKPITGIAIFGNITPFTHIMTVKAYKKGKALWETEITAKSEYDDVRVILPVMAAAGNGYFGNSTQGKKEVRLKRSDPQVQALTPEAPK